MAQKVGASFAPLTVRGIEGRFWRRFEEQKDKLFLPEIAIWNAETDQETEPYRFTGQRPQFREWSGERQLRSPEHYAYSLTNRKYEASEAIPVDDVRRDKTGQIMGRVGEYGAAAMDHWDLIGTEAIEAGTTALGYDGVAYFSAAHRIGRQTANQSNLLTASDSTVFNVSDPNTPTREELIAIIGYLVAHMRRFVDDQNRPMHGQAEKFCLVCPTNWETNANAATRNALTLQGGTNQLLQQSYSVNPKVNARLSSQAVGYFFRTDDRGFGPLIAQEETGVELSVLGPGSDFYATKDAWFFGAKVLRAVGYGEPLDAIQFTLS